MNSRNVTILLTGDVMCGRGIDQILPFPAPPVLYESHVRSAQDYVRLAEERNGPIPRAADCSYVWGDAGAELERHNTDARIVNLETAVTLHGEPEPKGINYRMSPRNAEILKAFRIDCCSLANNHVLDWGWPGLIETLDTLERLGIAAAGAGRDRDAAEAPAEITTARGERIFVFGIACETSGVPAAWGARNGRPGLSLIGGLTESAIKKIARRVATIRKPGDTVIISLHWGGNWGYRIPENETAFAHALIDEAHADIVHGHSSHHPKAIEVHHGKLILYGCGDFLNDYEGIRGQEEFRSDIALGYVAALDPARENRLAELAVLPFTIRNFRLHKAGHGDTCRIGEILTRESARFGLRFETGQGGELRLAAQ